MTNPVANEDQFAAEAEVRAMWDEAATRAARDHCAQLWRVGHGSDVPLEVEPHFDDAMDAWMSNYLFKAAARDPVRPRFVRNFMHDDHAADSGVESAIRRYVAAVKDGSFPVESIHTY